ncbi:related to histone deacetylase [Melanopsichium pennsylvanicum]|uniref:Related to histone deacetylase n=2 Tax=Melanopsichium pennsylvanicum TaxID=63383 RepID=A0AAJ4XQV1_9BASI|nr:related to histone deacetylase [Melanopsichium pennsylvanicum 4]SNX86217.1 related to histone deacetylase [Melanopsichium pennsylvanicum]
MSLVTSPSRVAYILSSDLINYSDLLPSNQGRSSLVHSLAYHLDLLDLSMLDRDESDTEAGPSTVFEKQMLLTALNADPLSSGQSECGNRRRALVYPPKPATSQQLSSYHQESFVRQLSKLSDAEDVEHHSKRRKQAHSGSLSSTTLRTPSSLPSSSSSSSCADDGSDQESGNLRPSSSASGPSRSSGHKRINPERNQFGLTHDCPPFQGLSHHVSLIAGASMTAAELLAAGRADIAICWDGGRHHAKKDSASGFCYVNDVVLAILALRKPRKVTVTTTAPREEGLVEKVKGGKGEGSEKVVKKTMMKRIDRVLYLDLDLHWGDGVEEAFQTSPNVLTLSIHHFAPGFFPCYTPSSDAAKYGAPGSINADTGKGGTSFNIALNLGTSDDSLERVMMNTVEPLVQVWGAEMVVVQCGVDGLAGDPMAVWNLSARAYVKAIQRVLGWKKPTLLLGGGGYNSESAARVWTLLTAVCLNRFHDQTGKDGIGNGLAVKRTTHENVPIPLIEQKRQQQTDSNENQMERNKKEEPSLDRIGYETLIPDHKYWPNYDPEYTLDVPSGEMIDQNDQAHFEVIDRVFFKHIKNMSCSSTGFKSK